MGSFFGNVVHAVAKGASDIGHEVARDYHKITTDDPVDPNRFSSVNQTSAQSSTPYTTTPPGGPTQAPPGTQGGASSYSSGGYSSQQQLQIYNAVHSNPDFAGVIQTIGDDVGKIAGYIGQFLPHNADGSVDWGKVGSDVVGYIKDHKQDILDGISAYENYERQNKADQLGQKAVDLAQQHYDERKPLRDAGMAGMLDPKAGTPDLSALSAQGQTGAPLAALPVAASNTNMQNAQRIAGAGSGNPFAKGLPVAGAPSGPSGPSGTPTPIAPPPIAPRLPTPLPIGGQPPATFMPPSPVAPLPVAQSGPIANGPQNKTYPQTPFTYQKPQFLPLPVAPPAPVAPVQTPGVPSVPQLPQIARY